jgi:Na+/H+ antiporter NhaD/arsenite permease-like protein
MDVSSLDAGDIRAWRSIVTLIIFVLTSEKRFFNATGILLTPPDLVVLFHFCIPLFVPAPLELALHDLLAALRVVQPRSRSALRNVHHSHGFIRHSFPLNLVTAPIAACLFLLAIGAIGREEVRAGTIGAAHISPLDIMLFFITLAYIAISIDATGLIRWLAYRVLVWGRKSGGRLFFSLYAFFALIGTFIGNDPIILSGTPFLAYMTRVSQNIDHPRAWIFTQFAIANVVSAILVSSNPTNLVLAGAFQIKYIEYTANMVVPVVVTVILLFPFLLYVVFRNEKLIPKSIEMHDLPEDIRQETPRNPCIPFADDDADIGQPDAEEKEKLRELAAIINPFLDKKSATFGAVLMAVTLITVLALNAANPTEGELPVFWITLPAAVVMLGWDLAIGWLRRDASRAQAREGRRQHELLTLNPAAVSPEPEKTATLDTPSQPPKVVDPKDGAGGAIDAEDSIGRHIEPLGNTSPSSSTAVESTDPIPPRVARPQSLRDDEDQPQPQSLTDADKTTLVLLVSRGWAWARETFPTATFVLAHLPLPLVPFAFAMFILVQALVTKGWVPVFAHGWDHWVNRTGTVGAIGGMGFVSVVFSNVSPLFGQYTNQTNAILPVCRH